MYTCSQVTKWIASDEYLRAGLFKRLKIKLHLAMCEHCSRYLRQLRSLAAKLRGMETEIPASEVEAAQRRILERIARKS